LQSLELVALSTSLVDPVWVGSDPATNAIIALERPGRLVDVLSGEVLLDIDARVGSGATEQGLLGLAFPPGEVDLAYFYYTDVQGDTVVAEFSRAVAGAFDPDSERVLLTVDQPAANHNGGSLEFGPDGMLYIGLGDGGGANDQFGTGQDPFSLLGTIVRLDPAPSADLPYTIPADNPMPEGMGDPLVYAYGLRNPWRFTFDGDRMYVADVGQRRWEEVSVVAVPGPGVENFGWPVLEGSHCFQTEGCDRSAGLMSDAFMVDPVVEYGHDEGCSITGGVVMRDPAIPELDGLYIYGDYCDGWVRGFFFGPSGVSGEAQLLENVGQISSFGFDPAGGALIATLGGGIYSIRAAR
jgi:glucose/arabinose dehydrogenase